MPTSNTGLVVRCLFTVAALISAHARAAGQPVAWAALPDMPTARIYAGAAALGGRVYVLGGCVVQSGAVMALGAVESYGPDGNAWRSHAPMPTPRSSFGTAVVDGRIFVVGGTATDTRQALGVVEVYDPRTDSWQARAPMPTPRSQVAVVFAAGKIYAIGGNAGHERAFEVYDPARDIWTAQPPLAAPRRNAGAVAIADRVYVFGGVTPDGSTLVDTLDEFDPATGRWSRHAAAPTARTDFALVAVGSRIVAIGGFNKGPISRVEEYDTDARVWSAAADLPKPLQFPAAAVLDGIVHVAGGTSRLPAAGASFLAGRAAARPPAADPAVD